MPIHRWMASAAGGTSQRLKAGPATVRSLVKKPGNVATDDMGLPLGDALSNVSAEAEQFTAKRRGSEDLGRQNRKSPGARAGALCVTWPLSGLSRPGRRIGSSGSHHPSNSIVATLRGRQ